MQGTLRRKALQGRAHFGESEAVAGRGADNGHAGFQNSRPVRPSRRGRVCIRLVLHHGKRDFPLTQQGGNPGFVLSPAFAFRHQKGHVGPLHDPQAAFRPQFSQFARVIQTRSVQKNNRSQGSHFQRFFHRVGGGAGRIRHDGHLLSGQGVEQ